MDSYSQLQLATALPSPPKSSENGALSHGTPAPTSVVDLTEGIPAIAGRFRAEIFVEEPSSSDSSSDDDVPESSSPTTTERPRCVRFRSRVRITSGLHHHHHRHAAETSGAVTPPRAIPVPSSRSRSHNTPSESSLSSSPSSSISAPLRSREHESPQKSRWGPLGQRVNVLGHMAGRPRSLRRSELPLNAFEKLRGRTYGVPNERTPLVAGPSRLQGQRSESSEEREARLNRELNLAFGKLPGRLFNRHWWWWQLEPVVRCRCLDDESDSDI